MTLKWKQIEWRLLLLSFIIGVSFIVALFPSSGEARLSARPLPFLSPDFLKVTATGYCPSYGGSTEYESIKSVTLTPNPSGTYKLEVQIFIANPTGCVAGEPCPEYDNSPEYVNAWIDWNGDKVWDNSEKVMDAARTGYLSINYYGTMTAIAQFSPPSSVTKEPTYMRVNLGWGHDPNDPCEEYWDWGNVVDQQIHLKPPKIKSFTAKNIEDVARLGDNPTTGKNVRLEAVIDVPAGYEITNCRWTGDPTIGPGNGDPANKCRYEYKPPTGKTYYGEKKVKLTITYKHTASGATGQDSLEDKYKVFFDKKGDDDGNGNPNWFDYWKQDINLDGNVRYLAGVNWGRTDTSPLRVYIGNNAGYGPEPRHGKIGIDCFYCVTTHELRHLSDIQYVANTYGGLTNVPPANDTDGNRLPNEIDPFPNAVNGAGYPEYAGGDAWKGDWEHRARQVENVTASINLDWANPGKQAGGNQSAKTIHFPIGSLGFGYDDSNLARAEFTGNYSDRGTDSDGDGLYNYLTLDVQLSVAAAGSITVVGGLKSGEATIWAETTTYLDTGTQWITLNFAGTEIYQRREDGPYSILLSIALENWLAPELVSDTYPTSAYGYTDFEHPIMVLTGNYTDTGMDTDSDSLYDLLRINVGVDVQVAGTYTIIGELEGSSPIAVASKTVSLSTGSQSVDLDFNGQLIFQSRKDGPYHLRKLRVEDTSGNRIDFIYDAYTTAAYTYTQFQRGGAAMNAATYSDQGLDLDGDGDFDYLRVEFQINVNQGGSYRLSADLDDSNGELIANIEQTLDLTPGSTLTVTLDFPGSAIYLHGVDGPYQVARVTLLNANGDISDYQQVGHTTQAYSYTDFGKPPVSLTGNYRDYGQDTNSNGLYDYLVIEIGVLPDNAGVIIANGSLVDSIGHVIEWATNNVEMTAGTEQVIQLFFNGKLIHANGVNGPFELRDLYVYNTGDPGQGTYTSLAYTTGVYSYTDFEDIYPPTGSITINSGATYTNSTSVILTLSASDPNDVSQMCISNTNSCSSWETYTTSKPWTLPVGDGVKTVYAWFKDSVGNANTTPYSDSIILDTTAPSDGTLSATAGNAQVSLSWSGFSDVTSGIGSYKLVYSTSGTPSSCSSGTQIYSGSGTSYTHTGLTNGTPYYYRVCATDNAGNTSSGAAASAKPQAPPAVTCSFAPDGTQLIRGGTLRFWANAQNNEDTTQNFKFVTKVKLPNGNMYPPSGWLLGPIPVTLDPHTSKSKYLTQFIPYNAPFGTYTYYGYVGTAGPPVVKYNECQFNFTVVQ